MWRGGEQGGGHRAERGVGGAIVMAGLTDWLVGQVEVCVCWFDSMHVVNVHAVCGLAGNRYSTAGQLTEQ